MAQAGGAEVDQGQYEDFRKSFPPGGFRDQVLLRIEVKHDKAHQVKGVLEQEGTAGERNPLRVLARPPSAAGEYRDARHRQVVGTSNHLVSGTRIFLPAPGDVVGNTYPNYSDSRCSNACQFDVGLEPQFLADALLGASQEATWRPVRFAVMAISLIWRGKPPDDVFRVATTVPLGEGPTYPS